MSQGYFNSKSFLTLMGRSALFAPPYYLAFERWSSSPYINRFLSADTIVPGYTNPQNLNRYSYVLNNPLRYTDPTGHAVEESGGVGTGCMDQKCRERSQKIVDKMHKDKKKEKHQDIKSPTTPTPSTTTTPVSGGANNYSCFTNFAACGAGAVSLIPPLPPSPFACGWVDCALSAASILASGVAGATEYEAPEIAAVAVGVDIVVTAVSFFRTVEDYHQGEISVEREWILNGTGVLGVIPIGPFGAFGFAFSVINGMATFSGYPP